MQQRRLASLSLLINDAMYTSNSSVIYTGPTARRFRPARQQTRGYEHKEIIIDAFKNSKLLEIKTIQLVYYRTVTAKLNSLLWLSLITVFHAFNSTFYNLSSVLSRADYISFPEGGHSRGFPDLIQLRNCFQAPEGENDQHIIQIKINNKMCGDKINSTKNNNNNNLANSQHSRSTLLLWSV